MNRDYSNAHYTTFSVNDGKMGYAALELHRTAKGETKRVARVVFWDASGQFFFETFDVDIPLEIAEDLIAEAKKTIQIQ
jgi:hypothetical protein